MISKRSRCSPRVERRAPKAPGAQSGRPDLLQHNDLRDESSIQRMAVSRFRYHIGTTIGAYKGGRELTNSVALRSFSPMISAANSTAHRRGRLHVPSLCALHDRINVGSQCGELRLIAPPFPYLPPHSDYITAVFRRPAGHIRDTVLKREDGHLRTMGVARLSNRGGVEAGSVGRAGPAKPSA